MVFIVLAFVTLCSVVLSYTGKWWRLANENTRADFHPGIQQQYRASKSLGGGSNFVIVLAANEGGGVMEWKGPREWAIERDSVRNKKKYAERWGYNLEITDMSTKKRYAHEWRESWEKVDKMRDAMAKYPKAEWYVNLRDGLMRELTPTQVLVDGSKHFHHGTITVAAETPLQ